MGFNSAFIGLICINMKLRVNFTIFSRNTFYAESPVHTMENRRSRLHSRQEHETLLVAETSKPVLGPIKTLLFRENLWISDRK